MDEYELREVAEDVASTARTFANTIAPLVGDGTLSLIFTTVDGVATSVETATHNFDNEHIIRFLIH
jgi:TRAP-type mannitol/chloroaromatic compound transport system permease large subunit